jgi:hypothetical protein
MRSAGKTCGGVREYTPRNKGSKRSKTMTRTTETTGKAGRKAEKYDSLKLMQEIEKEILEGILENQVP